MYVYIPVRALLVYLKKYVFDHLFEKKLSLIVFRHKFYQNLSRGAHF